MSAKERGDQNAVVDALRSIQPAVFIPASVVIVAMIVVPWCTRASPRMRSFG